MKHAWYRTCRSEDGQNWTFSGTAYNNSVAFADGGHFVFSRMERPHLIFGAPAHVVPPHVSCACMCTRCTRLI
jgi:hypothetical protein